MKIAIAGFQHETNTFASSRAGKDEFLMADSWPGLLIADAVITATRGMNLPIAGAIDFAEHMELVPILWCAAEPSGYVTDEAFDWVSNMLLHGIQAADDLDGIYLDLHGAMVTQSHEDGEGELLRRVRAVVGPDMPIGVSLDLHANISADLVDAATVMTIYRTYPHLDMADSGARCMRYLIEALNKQQYFSAFRQVDFLVPLQAQYTDQSPCRDLYQALNTSVRDDSEWVELAMGFTAADIHDCGPSVVAYAKSTSRANELADEVLARFIANKNNFNTKLISAAEAVELAKKSSASKPIILADVQDNPGAGGTSDTTGLLQALLDAGAKKAVLGVMCDPQVALQAHASGVDSIITADLGSKSGLEGHLPISVRFRIKALSDGQIIYSGQMYAGGVATLGPSCLLAVDDPNVDIRVVVSSIRVQCLDCALFTHFGVVLNQTRIICVKSTVHHRADFEPISSAVINVAAPGAFSCVLNRSDYQNLRFGVECLKCD
jgi:microcystin degradation protein MlrC